MPETKKKLEFEWSGNAPVSADADEVGRALERLPERTPDRIVDAARDPDHPLHDEFDWDDKSAARKQRKHRARQISSSLIRRVVVKRPDNEQEEKKVRAFVSKQDEDSGRREYKSTATEMTEREYDETRLSRLHRRLRSMRSRFGEYDWVRDPLNNLLADVEDKLE